MKKDNSSKDILKMFGILIIIVLISFAFGYFIRIKSSPKIETEYSNGFTFTKSGNFWYTTIRNPIANQDYNVEFRYSPGQVKNITVDGDPKKFFKLLETNNLTAAYFTFDPGRNLTYVNIVAADLAKFLKVINGITLVAGCTKNETDACHTRPIITCENQFGTSMVIYVKQSDTPKVSLNKNCLIVEGTGDGIIKAYTKLLFLWYSVL